MTHRTTPQSGFTLIEIMVAVSIFAIVALVVVSTFVVAANTYRKLQSIKLALDNLNFAMDSIAVRLREGTNYVLDPAADAIAFRNAEGDCMTYLRRDTAGRGVIAVNSTDPEVATGDLTSSEVNITELVFEKINSAEGQFPALRLRMKGIAGTRTKVQTEFELQTTVSQRNEDISGTPCTITRS